MIRLIIKTRGSHPYAKIRVPGNGTKMKQVEFFIENIA